MADQPIGVVVKTYPKLSETFILEELLGLEALGLDLRIISLNRPTDDRTNPETAEVRAPVSYRQTRRRMLVDHLLLAARRPVRYAATFAAAARRREPSWFATFTTAGWLASESQRLGLRHLHVHFLNEPASVTELGARLAGLRFSASAHAKDIYLTEPSSLRRKLSAATFTVTCTEHNRAYLAALVDDEVTVERVHHGVVLDRFQPPKRSPVEDQGTGSGDRHAGGSRAVLLAVGRLRAKKGFDLLIEACAKLRDQGLRFECRIVGYGPEEAALLAQIARLDLGLYVTMLGKLTRTEVIEQYGQASMLVQPCRVTDDGDRDGIPNVLLEAMAMELPVVTTPVSGIPELVSNDENGVLVAPDDPGALAAAITVLLDDGQRRRAIGRRARATVESSFTAEASAKQIARRLDRPTVAYVVKGYPRLSELFIATEIYRVERLGLPIRLFVLKPQDEPVRHEIVRETRATVEYLPRLTSISRRPVLRWLAENIGPYRSSLLRVSVRSPIRVAHAAAAAFAQAVRARKGRWPRKVYLKEFLQAAAIADGILDDPGVRHLHAHFCHGATTVTWLAAMMSGRTFSFTAHAKDIYREDLNPAGLLARKLAAAEFVTTCTGANHRHLAAIEPEAAIHTVYHGLNEEFVRLLESQPAIETSRPGSGAATDESRAGESQADGSRGGESCGGESQADDSSGDDSRQRPLRVLTVGRLVPKKGMDLLLDACVALGELGVAVELRVVGEDGDHAPTLRAMVADGGLGRQVSFLGSMNQRELFAEYRTADVFCLPCRVLDDGDRDGIPNVLTEAMAAGLAVVSTPISGIPELIDDRHNGLLVTPESGDAIAKALGELHRDPELRQQLANAGQETVRSRFDGWATTQELVDLLAEAAGK